MERCGSLHRKWRDRFERDWEDRNDRPFQVSDRAEVTGIMEASLIDKELKGRTGFRVKQWISK